MIRLAAFIAGLCLLAPAPAGAGGAALSASPSRISLAGDASETIRLTNPGNAPAVIDVARAGFTLDVRGRPRVHTSSSGAATWLQIDPRRLVLRAGATATLRVTSTLPRRPEPGDHGALILLTMRSVYSSPVAVEMRLGVVVTVRAPGAVVHRLDLRRLRVRRPGLLELGLANHGNVTEQLPRGRLRVTLRRGGRVLARLGAAPRDLLPRSSGVAALRYRRELRGTVVAVATLGARTRRYRIRL